MKSKSSKTRSNKQNQILIQFPDELCQQISKGIDAGKLPSINLRPVTKNKNNNNLLKRSNQTEKEYQRDFELHIAGNDKIYTTKLKDLPCIIESQKTYNKNLYFKTGDISQMLVVQDTECNNDDHNDNKYILDSGITPPSSDIRERWSHRLPICEHEDAEMDDYCPKCHNIPRALINKISKELYNRMHGQPDEIWELITTEEWIEVTDDESDEEMMDENAKMDKKLEHSHTINNEWEIDEDEELDEILRMKQEQQLKQQAMKEKQEKLQKQETESKKVKNETPSNLKRETQSSIKRPSSSTSSATNNNKKSINRNNHNSMRREDSKSTLNPGNSLRNRSSVSRTPAQPPLQWSTERRTSQRRTTPITTPRRNTPLSQSMNMKTNNLTILNKGQMDKNKKRLKEKKALEQKLKIKENELKVQQEKAKKQKNRKMKKKAQESVKALQKEIDSIQARLKTLS